MRRFRSVRRTGSALTVEQRPQPLQVVGQLAFQPRLDDRDEHARGEPARRGTGYRSLTAVSRHSAMAPAMSPRSRTATS